MKTTLITGADGFLGSNLVKKLLSEGKEVYGVVYPGNNLYENNKDKHLHIICMDLNQAMNHIDELPKGKIDTLYHFAWSGVKPELRNNLDVQLMNVDMTLKCMKFAKDLGVKKIIIPGSTNEYLYYGKPINKDAVPSPNNAYGAVKIALRYICGDFARKNNIEFIYAIVTGIYASDRRDNNVIFYTIDKLLHGEKPSLTKLEQLWDYVYIDDVLEALFLIGEKGRNGAVYAIGHGDNWELRNYIKIIHQKINENLPLGIGEIPYTSDSLPCSCIDLSDIQRDTGFVPKVDFEEGITKVIEKIREEMIMDKKIYVVGSGIVGCVIARELAEKGYNVTVWEKRDHTGGNLYDYTDEYGIHVHKYGPHIFHTNSERVWNYVNQFCQFENFNLICGSVMDGKCVTTSFDFQSVDVFFPEESDIIKEHIKDTFGERESATVLEMLDSEDEYVRKFATFLYDKDYAPYTAKQWGIKPEEVDRDIFKRVPVLFSYGSKYFNDKYQAMPANGYTELIDNLLNHKNITVRVNYDALKHLSIKEEQILSDGCSFDGTVIYTGPIDELFECRFGKLPYRSLRFEWKHEDIDSFQDMPVVAYPQADKFTRITEYKKLPIQNVKGTTYAVEYPLPYKKGENNEPYYPVLTVESKALYEKYKKAADKVQGLICCGRLADFKYYNMDQAIERALNVAEEI